MNRRSFIQKATATAASFGILRELEACATAPVAPPAPVFPLVPFPELRDRYFLYHLQRNPVTSTYLGGDGYSPELADANGRLRDFRSASLDAEVRFYRETRGSLGRILPASLNPVEQVDYRLMDAQLAFLIHQLAELRYYERSLDTYVAEPFRGVDWQIQQMASLPGGQLGTEAEWKLVVARTIGDSRLPRGGADKPPRRQEAGNIPDKRMVQRDGITGSRRTPIFPYHPP